MLVPVVMVVSRFPQVYDNRQNKVLDKVQVHVHNDRCSGKVLVRYCEVNMSDTLNTPCQGGCGKVRSILHSDDPTDWLCNDCRNKTLKIGDTAYYDSFNRLIPCRVQDITGTSGIASTAQRVVVTLRGAARPFGPSSLETMIALSRERIALSAVFHWSQSPTWNVIADERG